MRREFPQHAKGQSAHIRVDGAKAQVVKWYVLQGRHTGGKGAAAFEILTSEGETWKVVDDMDNGWMMRETHVRALLEETGQLVDQLHDFREELRELLKVQDKKQRELAFFKEGL